MPQQRTRNDCGGMSVGAGNGRFAASSKGYECPDAALVATLQLAFAASVATLSASSIALIVRTQRPHLAVQQSEA